MAFNQNKTSLQLSSSRLATAATCGAVAATLSFAISCSGTPAAATNSAVVPQYDKETGRLAYIEVDRDKDGKFEARAFMDGARIQRIEIDEDHDGKVERWEYYGPPATPEAKEPVILKAEEASATTGKVSRWEYYEQGALVRVDEDVDDDGRIDKWEQYRVGHLASVELDLSGSGKPEQRLTYQSDGKVVTESLVVKSSSAKGSGS